MSSIFQHALSRRSLLAAAPVIAGGLLAHRLNAIGAAQISVSGDCSVEPAMQYLYDFNTLNLTALPYRRPGDLDPGVDWQLVQSPELGVFLIPPDWNAFNGFANSFDKDGLPEWKGEQLSFPFWSTTIVISPDESTGYIFTRGSIDNVRLTPADGAGLARHLTMESGAKHTSLCLVEQEQPSSDMVTENWLAGDRYESDLMFSRGSILTSSVGGMNLGPGSTFLMDAIVAPEKEATDLMLDVYLKILYQQLPKGGSGAPTPTPSPTPW